MISKPVTGIGLRYHVTVLSTCTGSRLWINRFILTRKEICGRDGNEPHHAPGAHAILPLTEAGEAKKKKIKMRLSQKVGMDRKEMVADQC